MENSPTQNYSEQDDEEIAAILATEQEANISEDNLQTLAAEGRNYGKPSYLKYSFLFIIAAVIDIVDLADLTGIGIIISKIVTIGGTGIIYFTLWLTDGRMRKAHKLTDDLETAIADAQQKVARASRLAVRTAKVMRRIPGMKGLARKIPRAMVKIRRVARGNPLAKALIGGTINLVPFLAIINLMVVWVYLSYRDEKKAFKYARESSEEAIRQIEMSRVA